MARATTRGRKPAQNETAKAVLEALDILGAVKPSPDLPSSEYVLINQGWAVAYNGVIAIATKVDAGFNGFPHGRLLKEAMTNVGKKLTLTVPDENNLIVTTNDDQFTVPMMDGTAVIPTPPDANVFAIDDSVKEALTLASKPARDTAQTVLEASVLFHGTTFIGSDRRLVLEAWHGFNLPTGVSVPKAFVQAVNKIKTNLVGFGFGQETLTFHFQDGSYVRTQYYKDGWPENQDYGAFYNTRKAAVPVPATLFTALRQILPFTYEDIVILGDEHVQTHVDNETGTRIAVKGLFDTGYFNAKSLLALEELTDTVVIEDHMFIAYGKTTRAAISSYTDLPPAIAGTFEPLHVADPVVPAPEAAPASPDWGSAPAPDWGQGRAQFELEQMAQEEPSPVPFANTETEGATGAVGVSDGTPATGEVTPPASAPTTTYHSSEGWGSTPSPFGNPAGATTTEPAPSAGHPQTTDATPQTAIQSVPTVSPFEGALFDPKDLPTETMAMVEDVQRRAEEPTPWSGTPNTPWGNQ